MYSKRYIIYNGYTCIIMIIFYSVLEYAVKFEIHTSLMCWCWKTVGNSFHLFFLKVCNFFLVSTCNAVFNKSPFCACPLSGACKSVVISCMLYIYLFHMPTWLWLFPVCYTCICFICPPGRIMVYTLYNDSHSLFIYKFNTTFLMTEVSFFFDLSFQSFMKPGP